MMLPVIDALTSSTCPLRRATTAMISSAALPNVALRKPPQPGPDRRASSSVPSPISPASGMREMAAVRNTQGEPAENTAMAHETGAAIIRRLIGEERIARSISPRTFPTSYYATIWLMLNYIWFGLMATALVVAAVNGTADAVTKGAVEAASTAVQIAIGLVGIMTLWLGMMRVAEAAGLVSLVGRALRPLLRWLFPDVPATHPAAGAIVLALAANMLGLNNAATPLGIKAMEELQTLNPDKDTASNAMVTLMAVTTAGVQLIPASMIGVLAAAGSTNPTAIIAPTILATSVGTVAGLIAARLLQPFYPLTPPSPTEVQS